MNSEDKNQKIEERMANLEKRVAKLETTVVVANPIAPSVQKMTKQISAKEFLLSKDLSTVVEKTLTLAYFLEHMENVSPFNTDDFVKVFQAAREKIPTNINDMVNRNISKGLLMEVKERKDKKKAWILTASGEKLVESGFKH